MQFYTFGHTADQRLYVRNYEKTRHLYKEVTCRDKSTDVTAKCQLQGLGRADLKTAALPVLRNLLLQHYVLRNVTQRRRASSNKLLKNAATYLPIHTASHPRQQ
jgi:hypothetical protein